MSETLLHTDTETRPLQIPVLPSRSSSPLPENHSHAVQFYQDEAALTETVGTLIIGSLSRGEAALIVMEPHRLASLKNYLNLKGAPTAEALKQNQLHFWDAQETLNKFMKDGVPHSALFQGVLSDAVKQLGERFGAVNIYGEMVGVLWRNGNSKGTLLLEEEWNRLARTHSFSLLCGYSIHAFNGAGDKPVLEEICRAHEVTHPSETFLCLTNEEDRRKEIASLQQQAAALARQIEERKAIENQLRSEIKQRELLEQKLTVREQELTDFIENAPMAMHWVGPDGIIQWANEAELSFLGYSKEEYIGQPIAKFHADATISDILKRLSRKESLKNYEARLRCKDGSIKTVQISSNVRWENNRFVHTRCFTQDITDKKRADIELKKRAEELGRSNEELARFAHVASHDLKEPIRTVTAYVQLLSLKAGQSLPDDVKPYMRFIVEGAQRMEALVNDLLAYSTAGHSSSAESGPVDCNDLIDELKTTIRHTIEEAEAEIICEPLPIIYANRSQLSQVFQNLICNSIKFQSEEHPIIRVTARKSGGDFVFSVIDNGIGIEPKYQERVFGLFQRLHDRGSYPGTGLGLALCRKIVEKHGGKIWLDANAGAGATFCFTLPAAPELAPS